MSGRVTPTTGPSGWATGSPPTRPGPIPAPNPAFVAITDHLAFYPRAMDACWVDDERVEANEGDFYGGWITSSVVGPFKGAPGTGHW